MSNRDQLSKDAHNHVFREDILPEHRLSEKSSLEKPKAIILGGQPGSGKGRVVDVVKSELRNDVLVIDPDQLRDYHPHIDKFRSENPYTWSTRTMADAGRWAAELRDVAVAGRKNIILDGTLSNGEASAKLIRHLQAQGYEVEVRVVASPKLESELGVDERFTTSMDKRGYGRYVPETFRDTSYDMLPRSLDTIHANTNARIRIFNREGAELYDSRINSTPPGQPLEEARFARLKNPVHAQQLRADWNQQREWHRNLPEQAQHLPNTNAETQQNVVREHATLKVSEGVTVRAEGIATIDELVRPGAPPARVVAPEPELPGLRRMQGAAELVGLGFAASAYDANKTGKRLGTLLDQDNPTAVRSEAMHFAGRGVGGWGGGTIAVALFGSSGTGPIALGIADAYLFAKAGEKLVDMYDYNRIYNQTDSRGVKWSYNGTDWERPGAGDLTQDGKDNPAKGMFRAAPEQARELNYLASTEAVKQALGKLHADNPYSQPASAQDRPHLYEHNWTRDPFTRQWSRMVADEVDRNDRPIWRSETASVQRNASLDQQAAQIVEANIARGPASMAARYECEYKAQGWKDFDEVPAAVQTALNSDRLTASDGQFYVRQEDGQWRHGNGIAQGNIALELEETRQRLIPALAQHQQVLARIPERVPPTPEQRDHGDLMDAYAGYHIELKGDYRAAIEIAAQRTRQSHGIALGTAGYALEPDAHGYYDVTRPILHTRDDANGVSRVIATTSAADIQAALEDVKAERIAPAHAPAHPSTSGPSTRQPHSPHDADRDQSHATDKTTLRPASTRPDHKDHALFEAIRLQLPSGVSEDKAAEILLGAKVNGITSAAQLKTVTVDADRIFVMGKTIGDMAIINLSTAAPALQDTLRASATFDHQQMQEIAQFQAQQQRIEQNAQSAGARTLGQ